MKVYIMRGIPGSGKSTWITNLSSTAGLEICSADHFHMEDGKYVFKPENAKAAHDACFRKFAKLVTTEKDAFKIVVVDNTNIQPWEYSPYYRLAEMFDHETTMVECNCPFEVVLKRQTHGVPPTQLMKMYRDFMSPERAIPPNYKWISVFTG